MKMNALDLVQALRSVGTPIDVHRCYWHVVREGEERGLIVATPLRVGLNAAEYVRVSPKPRLIVNNK